MKLEFNRIEKPFLFEVENASGAQLRIDASRDIGGSDRGLRPMELVASGVAGCIAIDVILILEKQRLSTEHFAISIAGTRSNGTPSPFEAIHLVFDVDKSLDRERLSRNIQLVIDKYCSVSASLHPSIDITFEIT
jgi:putative redox protein